jgi:hypothetical protein
MVSCCYVMMLSVKMFNKIVQFVLQQALRASRHGDGETDSDENEEEEQNQAGECSSHIVDCNN